MNCLTCNETTTNPKYCSRSCAAKSTNKVHPKRKAKANQCEKCSVPIKPSRKFCDECCKVNWETRTLENCANYKHNHKYIVVRQHAKQVFFKNNPESKCFNCGYIKHIEVCHIKAISNFSLDTPLTVVNSTSNLIGLCPNCHWEFDNNLLTF